MPGRLREGLLQVVGAAGVGVEDHEALQVEFRLLTHSERLPVARYDLLRDREMRGGAAVRAKRGVGVVEIGREAADRRRHLRDVGHPEGLEAPAEKQEQHRDAVHRPAQVATAGLEVDEREPQVEDVALGSPQLDRQPRHGAERHRPRGLSLVDDRQDRLGEPLPLPCEGTVGERAVAHGRPGDDPEVLHYACELGGIHPGAGSLEHAACAPSADGELEVHGAAAERPQAEHGLEPYTARSRWDQVK